MVNNVSSLGRVPCGVGKIYALFAETVMCLACAHMKILHNTAMMMMMKSCHFISLSDAYEYTYIKPSCNIIFIVVYFGVLVCGVRRASVIE